MFKCIDNKNSAERQFRDLKWAHRMASDAVFEKFGVREFGQPRILFTLEQYGKDGAIATQKELAERMRVSPTTITISLKSLERLGCIRKIADTEDMRRNRIEITEKGKTVASQCRKAFADVDEAMYTGFSKEERDLINSFFARMTTNLINVSKIPFCPSERNEQNDQDNV